jgi:hypothetical protein
MKALILARVSTKEQEDGHSLDAQKQRLLTPSQVHRLLMNPFYYGEMQVNGELDPHRYEPLITRELFERCEATRLAKNSKATAVKQTKEDFIFRSLITCAVSGRITQDIYDTKASLLKQEHLEKTMLLKDHKTADDSFKITVSSLFALASQAYDLFKSSKNEQKRRLIGFLFSNLQLRGEKLEFSLRSPFDLMVNPASYEEWRPHGDSNPGRLREREVS